MKNKPPFPACEKCTVRHHSILSALTREQQEGFTEEKGCNFYKKGEVLFHAGGKPSGVHCLHTGKVKVYKSGSAGQNHILRLCGPGEMVGFDALLSNAPYHHSARAIEDTLICFIPGKVFKDALSKNETLNEHVNHVVFNYIRETECKLVDLSQKVVRVRLAETLLYLWEKFGSKSDGKTIDIELTREEIANIVGTAPESIIRMLSGFKDQGIIELSKRNIAIKDLKGLKNLKGV